MSKPSLKSLALAATLAVGLSAAMTGLADARSGGGGDGGHMLTIVTPDAPTLPLPNRNVAPPNQSTASQACLGERPSLRRQCERRLRY